MPYLVGDSFGGVQSAQTAEDQQRRLAFASSMSNLLGSLRERNEMNFRNNQLQLQREHEEKALQLQRDLGVWQRQIQEEHNNILMKGTEQYGKFMDWQMSQPNAAKLKEQDYQNALAERQANAGYFEDPAHVKQVYPQMSDAQAGLLADQSQRARQGISFDYQTAQDAAGTLNKQAELDKAIADERKNPHNEVPWYSVGGVKKAQTAALAPLLEQKGEVDRRVSRINSDKRLSGLVTFDPDSGKYMPAVPTPQWGATARTPTGAPTGTPEDQAGGVGAQGSWATPGAGGTGTGTVTPEDQAGGAGASTGTAGGARRKYAPMVYDRAQYWTQQGLPMPNALARALQETSSVQGDQLQPTNPEDQP